MKGTHNRWRSYQNRRVTFVLADADHKLILVPVMMRIRIKDAHHDRNVYEGDINGQWVRLLPAQRSLEFVGVLYADGQREFAGQIGWVEDNNDTIGAKTASVVRAGMTT